jgi:hypothetical protein
MKKVLLFSLVLTCLPVLFPNCGGSSTWNQGGSAASQLCRVSAPKPNTNLFYAVLEKFTNHQFTTSMIQERPNGEYHALVCRRSERRRQQSHQAHQSLWRDEDPYFASDGTHIAFSREDLAADAEDVYIVKADGTGVTELTPGVGLNFDPLIVRDATTNRDRILFSSNRYSLHAGSAGFELYTMKTDRTVLTRLTNNTSYDSFSLELLS